MMSTQTKAPPAPQTPEGPNKGTLPESNDTTSPRDAQWPSLDAGPVGADAIGDSETVFMTEHPQEWGYLAAAGVPAVLWTPLADCTPLIGRRVVVLHKEDEVVSEALVAALYDVAAPLVEIALPHSIRGMYRRKAPDDLTDEERAVIRDWIMSYLNDSRPLEVTETPPRSSEPTPLMRPTADPEPFPIDAMMPHTREAAELVQRGAQCPMDIAATTVLCTAAAAVQHQANLQVDGRTIPLVLFAISVASSGHRKSQAENIATEPIKDWIEDSKDEYARALLNYKADLAAYQTAKRAIESEGKRSKGAPSDRRRTVRERLLDLGDEPEPPRRPAIVIKDWTMEGVEKHQATVWPSVALFTMEGGVAVGGWSMKAENLLYSLGKLSTLWDGAESGRVRAGDGYEGAPGYRGSLHLGIQYKVAERLLGNEMARNQGFLARTLIVWPESLEGTRFNGRFDPYVTDEYARWNRMLRAALDRPLPWINPDRPSFGLRQRTLRLDPDAYGEYERFYNHIEKRLAPDGVYRVAAPFAAKLAEQALRIAAIQELVSDPDIETVSHEAVVSGIQIANHFLTEYIRCIGVAEVDQELRLAQEVLDWIRDKEGGEVTSSRMMQFGPYGVRTADTVTRIMEILVQHGHVVQAGARRWKAASHA